MGWCPNAKAHEARRHVNLDNSEFDVPDRARGDNRDLRDPGWLRRVSTQILLFAIFLTFVNLLLYNQIGLNLLYLGAGLLMVLFDFAFRWNKQIQRYDAIAKKPIVRHVPKIKSLRGLLAIINLLFRISVLFLFCWVLVPYMFNFGTPPISGVLLILLFLTWGYYFPLIYWEKKNHMKIYRKSENSFEKTYVFEKTYAIGKKRENCEP